MGGGIYLVFVYLYAMVSSNTIIYEVNLGGNITFGFNGSCDFNNITWEHNTPIANWSKPNVTFSKSNTKYINISNPCYITIYNACYNDTGNYTLHVCTGTPLSTRCKFTFLLYVFSTSNQLTSPYLSATCISIILPFMSVFLFYF
ncbi:membrane protein EE52 [Proboscivirus elephantidbeta5]|uniref:Membrane protein EE52 n=1 Tax=Elephant endotheliotropic herpesvirus 5 TaxID=768738 RepID=A0A075CYD6_9BETA|nr:membrane protein EE52 [Elephant endotheliotropic herpesvirus 5]AHC02810.1 membrane protein EE52 [Elephant endotheliotropic herpesvirus 5]